MNNPNLKVILTGATGMVGEGVLNECLNNSCIAEVLIVNRRNAEIRHPKLKEIVYPDLYDLSNINHELSGYDACLFCLGVSSIGRSDMSYYRNTYSLTMHFAETVFQQNKNMVFCYVSGAGTDSSEKGRVRWAKVKGKTENDLMKLSFKRVYNFRPGVLEPTKKLKNTLGFYKYLGWLIPIIKIIAPRSVCSLKELGDAMVNAVFKGYDKQVLEVPDIKQLATS